MLLAVVAAVVGLVFLDLRDFINRPRTGPRIG
jgi:hypothetical protein